MMRRLSHGTVVIGSGASGYAVLTRLLEGGRDAVMVTEKKTLGTSRNAGSDKQTYYKLGLGGDTPDSTRLMARDLFNGGCVDGDNALVEAALSTRCFMRLVELGVEFPVNRCGEYIGYKTDHDPYARATSAGPLTSRDMTEALESYAERLGATVYEYYAEEILTEDNSVIGVLCRDGDEEVVISCGEVVLATGGPAGVYADSVYPVGHTGSTGLALWAGASVQNITEWQYGLASVNPRWNVSGTYMQTLPRVVSVDESGVEHNLLEEYFDDKYDALTSLFMKGYQWPFNTARLDGSSRLDIAVWRERTVLKRRVFLDWRENPFDFDFKGLSDEAYSYLEGVGACFGRPIDRLKKMNMPAYELYLNKGVDLECEMLEIALSAQHCNGGISVNEWWQTSVEGLFAVGECAGTHGVTRPGGSALNSGQVGALRASQYILAHPREIKPVDYIFSLGGCDIGVDINTLRCRMSDIAAAVRDIDGMKEYLEYLNTLLPSSDRRLRDTVTVQRVMLEAMLDFYKTVGTSRGSALYFKGDLKDFKPENRDFRDKIQEVSIRNGEVGIKWRPVREIPSENIPFETVWSEYRIDKNVR
ncbi:MAG: FAD-binding protein [Clostridia bacterium]|nr:FAD-binding protein [Clostridia bacterium]